ncbi:FAD binding domain-containing protein [Glacieibacterium megasporae]|uniref:FAD binding domain-containing protein n=1 Tax=Glacieibacterium megasporae TaxID=2835787 RepID=UPI002103A370|nr:FAD binding domain-containing protein [Polymorphobacter megasporae]
MRDPAQPCNKRDPGSGCAAVRGFNRLHAIFGQTDEGPKSPFTCIAVHPSDMAVAMAALDAAIVIESGRGARRIAFDDLHRLPGNDPSRDTNLAPDDLIVAIELPAFHGRSHYLKVRDRASYAYGLVSSAITVEMDGDQIARARIALGGIAHKPWRLPAAEAMLAGERPSEDLFRRAAAAGLEGARTYPMNGYKPELARVLVARGLAETTGLEPLQGAAGTAFAASVGGIAGVREVA